MDIFQNYGIIPSYKNIVNKFSIQILIRYAHSNSLEPTEVCFALLVTSSIFIKPERFCKNVSRSELTEVCFALLFTSSVFVKPGRFCKNVSRSEPTEVCFALLVTSSVFIKPERFYKNVSRSELTKLVMKRVFHR
ncbi:hypothetical protein BXY75_2271 [Ulvibacter antarcticus]|uniref:Uncharacterized protein n=1 Tax=Ulvibacter antarcticus TaxID=442714 RepID=A0A3L9YHF9_9FLAO|nr:hypothetical protein BXY75_2271 [Ulvibacter antarcticus]